MPPSEGTVEEKIYLYSAIAGCTLVLLQVVLQVFGLFDADADVDGGHGDVGADHDVHDGDPGHGNAFFGILSFKALCAFAGIFGLVGLAMIDRGAAVEARVAVACGSGIAGMFAVAWMMRGLSRLQASGTIRIENAVGRRGTVYLRVPGGQNGRGKVTIDIQGRSMEFEAVTEGDEIATGRMVTVVAVENDETLKVVPA